MNTNENAAPVAVPPQAPGSPSDFLRLGLPWCSIFGETWHEMTALVYLHALVAEGDKWQPLTPDQVREAVKKLPPGTLGGGSGSVLANAARLQLVADKLTSADDARAFSPAWRMKKENIADDPQPSKSK